MLLDDLLEGGKEGGKEGGTVGGKVGGTVGGTISNGQISTSIRDEAADGDDTHQVFFSWTHISHVSHPIFPYISPAFVFRFTVTPQRWAARRLARLRTSHTHRRRSFVYLDFFCACTAFCSPPIYLRVYRNTPSALFLYVDLFLCMYLLLFLPLYLCVYRNTPFALFFRRRSSCARPRLPRWRRLRRTEMITRQGHRRLWGLQGHASW